MNQKRVRLRGLRPWVLLGLSENRLSTVAKILAGHPAVKASGAREPAQVIFPGSCWKRWVGRENRQFIFSQVLRLAVGNSHVRKLTDKSESNRAQNRFLETCADDGVAVRPHQHRRAVFQCLRKRFSPFDSADETRLGIDRRAFGWKESRVHVQRPKTPFQYTEKRAPLRVGMANARYIRTRAHDAGVNRPLIGRRFLTTEIAAIEVQQDEPIQRRPAGTHTGQSKKSVGT